MGSKVKYVTGEPVPVRDSKDFIDRIIEGPDTQHRIATDTHGNTGSGSGFDPQTAEDRAVFNLNEKRRD